MTRWALRIAVVGGAAAALNVVVAWACVLWLPLPEGPWLPLRRHLQERTEAAPWPVTVPPSWPPAAERIGTADRAWASFDWYTTRAAYARADGTSVTVGVRNGVLVFRFGLPFRSMEILWETGSARGGPMGVLAGPAPLPVPEWVPVAAERSAARGHLPLRPIWTLFLVNSLVYAALLAVPWWGLAACRRMWRRRTGRCVRCAYDRHGAPDGPCPECGAGRRGQDAGGGRVREKQG